MYRFLLLVLWVPALVSSTSVEDLYDEAVAALSQDLVNSTADLKPFRHEWTQRLYIIFKENCYFDCDEGVAGPLGSIERPRDMPVLENNGSLVSSVSIPNIRFNYPGCILKIAFSGSEPYTGLAEDVSLDLAISLTNSSEGCVATVTHLEVGTYKGVTFDSTVSGLYMAQEFNDLKLVTRIVSDNTVEGLNAHFGNFVNRSYTLSSQCPS